MASQPGIGGPAWQAATKDLGHAADAVEFWTTPERYDPGEGAPVEALQRRVEPLVAWTAARLATADEGEESAVYSAAYSQAAAMATILARLQEGGRPRIPRIELDSLVDEVTRSLPDASIVAQAGHVPVAAHPGNVTDPVDEVFWWDLPPARRDLASPWSRAERDSLAAAGVAIPSVEDELAADKRAWMRPVLNCRSRLVVVVHEENEGRHPLWGRIQEQFKKGWVDVALDAGLLQGNKSAFDAIAITAPTLEKKPLPAPRRWWRLGQPLPRRDSESYTSLNKICYYPHEWALTYAARLRGGGINDVADGPILKGSLAHRLFERFFKEQADWQRLSDEEIHRWLEVTISDLIQKEGAVLLENGRGVDRQQVVTTLEHSLIRLLQHLREAGVRSVDSELAIERPFAGGLLRGEADLVLLDERGNRAVIDAKWGSENYRQKEIAEGRHLQLAVYGFTLGDNDWPATGYYIVTTGNVVAPDAEFFPSAIAAGGETVEAVWQRSLVIPRLALAAVRPRRDRGQRLRRTGRCVATAAGWAGNAGRARPFRRVPLADRRGAVPMTSTAQAGDGRFDHVTFISAGAGSGKTYRLIEELERAFVEDGIPPAGVLATTFTVKAATELRERVRDRLLANDRLELAERTAESLIGTVHSVCERLLRRFAFELGLSPQLNVMSIEDGARFFNQALDQVLPIDRVREMNAYSRRLGMVERGLPIWQSVVKDIADKARENDLAAQALRTIGHRNANDLLAFFPTTSVEDPTQALVEQVANTIVELPVGSFKGIDKYRQLLKDQQADLNRPDCPWSVWMRLAGTSTLRSINDQASRVQSAAAKYASHPAFHHDLRGYTQGLFDIAADTLERFQAAKHERGLIDFNDMERLTLHALDHDAVRERLEDDIQLLLVDEFQDTNPMQLALFMKLAAIADKAIFVGDVKQAIYEFRGCDPTLVFGTLEGLTIGNASQDTLDSSWRSRPALVSYVNELFASAFEHEIPRDLVVLKHERQEIDAPAVTVWEVDGNVEDRALAVAEGVARLIAAGDTVADPDSGRSRPISYGDIAVLARTNAAVERIARSLRQRQVPMKMTLSGLLDTAEVSLAKSCLRRLADRADTLASAEIMALADCAEPEEWLTNRLDWLADGGDSMAWGEADHPIIRRLYEMRVESALRSPVENRCPGC